MRIEILESTTVNYKAPLHEGGRILKYESYLKKGSVYDIPRVLPQQLADSLIKANKAKDLTVSTSAPDLPEPKKLSKKKKTFKVKE